MLRWRVSQAEAASTALTPSSVAAEYLGGFAPLPFSLVTGNHDLEGFEDFATDADNLEGWRRAFGQHHHWAQRAGGYLLVGLSTVRFRDAPNSCHEVFVDDEQLDWFARTLAANRDTPTLVFSHAPPAGSGLRTLPAVHVKNRCAWLNHGQSNARVFAELVAVNPQVKLWFSGHFHLSHDYADSLSVCGECVFVQVGVIGSSASRDGRSHSRLLRADASGFSLFTVDHNRGGALRLDASRSFAAGSGSPFVRVQAQHVALTSWPGSDWMHVRDSCPLGSRADDWLDTGNGELTVQDGALVEYDGVTRAPVGVVFKKILPGCTVRLVDGAGRDVRGGAAVAAELVGEDGSLLERVTRGSSGASHCAALAPRG